MKITTKIIYILAILIASTSMFIVVNMLFFTSAFNADDNFITILMYYGCILNPATVYLLFSGIVTIIIGLFINNYQREIKYRRPVLQIISETFYFKKAKSSLESLCLIQRN